MDQRKLGERKQNPSRPETKIARARIARGVTQAELAEATGISIRAIQELVRGVIPNPRIRNLINVAAALGLKLEDVCEDEWLRPGKLGYWQAQPDHSVPHQRVTPLKKRPGRFEE